MTDFAYESIAVGKYSKPASPHSAGEVHVSAGRVDLDTSLAINDIVGLCVLPKGCIPIDFTLKAEDLDDGVALVLDVGVAKNDKTDLATGKTFISGSTVGQAGGIDKPDAGDTVIQNLLAKNLDRIIAAKVTTAAGTPAAGELMGELFYRAAENGEWDPAPNTID